jgi:DNA repair protein RecO (recombination protein O)
MQLVKEVSRAFPLNSLPFELVKSTQALFMAEVLYRVVREEESNPILAQFLFNSIQYLDTLEEADPDYHIIFLFHLSRHLGFYPQNNYTEKLPYFDLISGQFVSFQRDPEIQLDREVSKLWNRYAGTGLRQGHRLEFHSFHRKEILDSLVRYYRNQVDGMGEIRSVEVLHDLFHNL